MLVAGKELDNVVASSHESDKGAGSGEHHAEREEIRLAAAGLLRRAVCYLAGMAEKVALLAAVTGGSFLLTAGVRTGLAVIQLIGGVHGHASSRSVTRVTALISVVTRTWTPPSIS